MPMTRAPTISPPPRTDPGEGRCRGGSATAPDPQDVAAGEPQISVLLVEDNPMSLRVLQAVLARPGYRTEIAAGGIEAVEAVARGDHDVVLMDLRLPGIDGLEATRRIRALPGPQRGVHIIAVTAEVTSDVERRCREAGMNDYLSKPFRIAILEEKLAAVRKSAIPKDDQPAGA